MGMTFFAIYSLGTLTWAPFPINEIKRHRKITRIQIKEVTLSLAAIRQSDVCSYNDILRIDRMKLEHIFRVKAKAKHSTSGPKDLLSIRTE